jgi:hypothetical protein
MAMMVALRAETVVGAAEVVVVDFAAAVVVAIG